MAEPPLAGAAHPTPAHRHPSSAGVQPAGRVGRARRLRKAVGFGLVFAGPVFLLAFVVREQVGVVVDLDERVVGAATDVTRANPWLRTFWVGWQEASQARWIYVAATVVCVVVWRRHARPTRAAWAFVTMMVAWNLQLVLKEVVRRARPVVVDPIEHAPGFSFPSGHVANAAAVATALVVLLWPLLGRRGRMGVTSASGVLVVVTCLDRVFLGVHYPSDVTAGVLFGVGLVTASYLGCRGWNPLASNDPPPPDDPPSFGTSPPGASSGEPDPSKGDP